MSARCARAAEGDAGDWRTPRRIAQPRFRNRLMAAFREGLREAGYVEGRNLAIEYRWAEGHYDRLPALAADLVGRKVDVIMANSPPSALAAKSATSTIPIVFRGGADPVGDGLVASLARPQGNATGVSFVADELTAKRLEVVVRTGSAGWGDCPAVNPNNPSAERIIRVVQEAAGTKGLQLQVLKAASESEIDTAFASLVQLHVGALVVGADPFLSSHREQIVALASRSAIPSIYAWREFAAVGGLISYGASLTLHFAWSVITRQRSSRAPARRSAGRAANDLRDGHQPQDRQGARH